MKMWHQYLVGKHFILFDQKVTIPSQFFWLFKLMAYDYEIQYKHGKLNPAADALSRIESNRIVIQALSSVSTELMSMIQGSWENDRQLQLKIQCLQQGKYVKNYSWTDQQLKRKGKLVVSSNSDLRNELLQYFHGSALGGHSRINGTYMKLTVVFYWKNQLKNVREFVRQCIVCQ